MKRYGNSFIKKINGVDYMELNEKNHYETGFAAGKLLVMSDNPSVKLLKMFPIEAVLVASFKITEGYDKEFKVPREYLDELKGYSDATGIPFKELFFLNFSYDILRKFGFGCSTFVFFNNSPLIGRNSDMDPIISELALHYGQTIVTKVSVPGKKSFVHAGIPLSVSVFNGFNESGIAVNTHEVLDVRERANNKKRATTLLTRVLLESAGSIKHAEKLIRKFPPHRPLNLMVTSNKEKDSRVFEINYPSVGIVKPDGKYLACTTFFRTEKMSKFHRKPVALSINRLDTLNKVLGGKKKLSIKEAINLLRDHRDGLKHEGTGASVANNGTLQSFIFDMAKNTVYVNNGKKRPVPLNGEYIKIKIK